MTDASNILDKVDATFIKRRPGLSGAPDSMSLESVNYPGHYLRHQNFRIKLHRTDGSELFHHDASFLWRPARSGDPDAVSLESVNMRDHFIRHHENELWLARSDAGNVATFARDASFLPSDGFVAEPLPCGVRRVGAPPIPTGPVTVPTFISTKRFGQLTGSTDPQGLPILNYANDPENVGDPRNRDWKGAGVEGIDLGACVEHKGRLYLYFGDVVGAGAEGGGLGADLVAWTTDDVRDLRAGGFTLHPVRPEGELFDPYNVAEFGIPGLNLAPSGGFSYKVRGNDRVFIFSLCKDDSSPHSWAPTTILTSKNDPSQPGPYRREFTFSYLGFWSVVPTVVKNEEHSGLPAQEGDGLILLAGGYPTAVHLAWMKLDPNQGPLLSTVQYYTGTPGNPWSAPSGLDEATARAEPLAATRHEGEAKTLVKLPPYFSSLSAAWLPEVKRWVLVNSTAVFEPHQPELQRPALPILARFGTSPWSWSTEVELFNPCRDLAFGHFIHWTGLDDIDSRVPPAIHPDKDKWAIDRGHPYGASVLSRFTTWEPATRDLELAYLLSTWNPYQVHVMRTRLRLP